MTSPTPFTCKKNGQTVFIHVAEDDYVIKVTTDSGQDVGMMEFRFIEGDKGSDALKLIWAYLDKSGPKYLDQGIGTECLKIAYEYWGYPIFAEDDHGHTSNDGGHPTGDAPTFLEKKRQQGLIL